MRNTVVNRIADFAKTDKKIFLITGDAGYSVLDTYQRDYPKRFLNLGVAEQNMIGFASGLALAGFKVFVYDIVPFVLYRCYEQVRNDICYQDLPVTLIGIGSGVTYAPGGVTHYSVEDIALARTLPNLTILSPSDPIEAKMCAEYAYRSKGAVYIRVAKTKEPVIHERKIKSITEPIVVWDGTCVAVLFHGSISIEVVKALEGLKRTPKLISVPMLHPMNFNSLKKELRKIHTIVTVEEHFVEGGLGSIIGEWIIREKRKFKLKKMGIKNEFIHAIKNNAGMRELYGISSHGIAKAIREAFTNS